MFHINHEKIKPFFTNTVDIDLSNLISNDHSINDYYVFEIDCKIANIIWNGEQSINICIKALEGSTPKINILFEKYVCDFIAPLNNGKICFTLNNMKKLNIDMINLTTANTNFQEIIDDNLFLEKNSEISNNQKSSFFSLCFSFIFSLLFSFLFSIFFSFFFS